MTAQQVVGLYKSVADALSLPENAVKVTSFSVIARRRMSTWDIAFKIHTGDATTLANDLRTEGGQFDSIKARFEADGIVLSKFETRESTVHGVSIPFVPASQEDSNTVLIVGLVVVPIALLLLGLGIYFLMTSRKQKEELEVAREKSATIAAQVASQHDMEEDLSPMAYAPETKSRGELDLRQFLAPSSPNDDKEKDGPDDVAVQMPSVQADDLRTRGTSYDDDTMHTNPLPPEQLNVTRRSSKTRPSVVKWTGL